MKDSWEGKFQNAGECEIRTGSLSFYTRLSKSFPHKKVAVNMGKIWLLLNLLGNQGSQRRSKNNLRGITIGIGHKEDKLSGPSSFLGAGYSKQQKPMNGAKNIYKNPRKHAPVLVNRARISSLGRALDCRAGGRGFDSREGPILQVIK